MTRRWHTLSDGEKDYAYDLWCWGYTIKEISKALYASMPTIHRAIGGRPRTKAVIAPYSEVRGVYEKHMDNEDKTSETGD